MNFRTPFFQVELPFNHGLFDLKSEFRQSWEEFTVINACHFFPKLPWFGWISWKLNQLPSKWRPTSQSRSHPNRRSLKLPQKTNQANVRLQELLWGDFCCPYVFPQELGLPHDETVFFEEMCFSTIVMYFGKKTYRNLLISWGLYNLFWGSKEQNLRENPIELESLGAK